MALASRLGNMLKQASSKHVSIESSLSNLSLCQAVRFMSSSKLFVGGGHLFLSLVYIVGFWLLYLCLTLYLVQVFLGVLMMEV